MYGLDTHFEGRGPFFGMQYGLSNYFMLELVLLGVYVLSLTSLVDIEG
jgi:hypothetical protein